MRCDVVAIGTTSIYAVVSAVVVVWEAMLLDCGHRVLLRLLHLEGQELLVQADQLIVAFGSLLAHFSQSGLHT